MRLLLALILAISLSGAPAAAQEPAQSAETAILREMLGAAPLSAGQFTPDLLAQVPLPQLQAIVDQLKGLMGPVTEVRIVGPGRFVVATATHEMPVQMTLNAAGDIMGIFFSPPADLRATAESLLPSLAVGDEYAYLVTKDGEILFAHNERERLAVGSAFKLGVLAVLKDAIDAGERAWDDVVTLEERDRSLPTGTIQAWPAGAPLTLHTAAAFMISQSDNTATDLLLRVVGKEAVEEKLKTTVLSTREFFVLKQNPELRFRYSQFDASVHDDIAAAPLPAAVTEPYLFGLEWYIPLTRLCAMMDEVGGLDVMHINPGVAQPGDWAKIAFKGGSEIGVLNLTTRAIAKDGSDYCVAVTWNDDAALNEAELTAAYSSLLSALARGA